MKSKKKSKSFVYYVFNLDKNGQSSKYIYRFIEAFYQAKSKKYIKKLLNANKLTNIKIRKATKKDLRKLGKIEYIKI